MNFRDYRPRGTIRAAEITEERMQLLPAKGANDSMPVFDKGDYVENRDGVLLGWKKADFEAAYAPVRAPRQSSGQKRKPRAKAAAQTLAPNKENV